MQDSGIKLNIQTSICILSHGDGGEICNYAGDSFRSLAGVHTCGIGEVCIAR